MTRSRSAGLEYHGIAGATQPCIDAVVRLLQCGDLIITTARILSTFEGTQGEHGLLLTTELGDPIAIKAGFSSGYGGEGPRGFSYVLQLLEAHGVEIDELEITTEQMNRLHYSSLTMTDFDRIRSAPARFPNRWYQYVSSDDVDRARDRRLWQEAPTVIPFSIIDPRLMDIVVSFWNSPDDKLLKGFRRWEDIVRERTGLKGEFGSKLASKAFLGENALLSWNDITDAEKTGRGNIIVGTIMTYRNPRSHTEPQTRSQEALTELLMLNHLYELERSAVPNLSPNTTSTI